MEIAPHNYRQDCYQCNISLLVMQPDAGVNEPAAETVQRWAIRQPETKTIAAIASI